MPYFFVGATTIVIEAKDTIKKFISEIDGLWIESQSIYIGKTKLPFSMFWY